MLVGISVNTFVFSVVVWSWRICSVQAWSSAALHFCHTTGLCCRKSTFQDSQKLYLLLEYVPGGELFKHLRSAGKFSLGQARFYAASIFLVFEKLHQQDYVYR